MVFDLKIILMKREHFVVFCFLEIENDLKVDMQGCFADDEEKESPLCSIRKEDKQKLLVDLNSSVSGINLKMI
jgi:hypothetical protein